VKAVVGRLSPQTKAALSTTIEIQRRTARKQGYDAGWHRGFRVGALCAVAVVSLAGLLVVSAAWVMA
jgi:hypothetical protein